MPIFLKAVDLVLNDLDMHDEERAQKVRVAVIREDRRRAHVMQTLEALGEAARQEESFPGSAG
jgi:hypothetical protein